jgi:hypothetical protein
MVELRWESQLNAARRPPKHDAVAVPPDGLAPVCRRWSAARAISCQAKGNGEKTPEGWAAAMIYSFLKELASRPEHGTAEV